MRLLQVLPDVQVFFFLFFFLFKLKYGAFSHERSLLHERVLDWGPRDDSPNLVIRNSIAFKRFDIVICCLPVQVSHFKNHSEFVPSHCICMLHSALNVRTANDYS